MNCEHPPCRDAIESPTRLGRAQYVCAACGHDVSLLLVLMAELEDTNDGH